MGDKITIRPDYEKKKIFNRINRISGQLNGVKKMIDENKHCNDILVQLSAIEKSINSLSNYVLECHLYNCVSKELEDGNLEIIDELVSLYKRFNK